MFGADWQAPLFYAPSGGCANTVAGDREDRQHKNHSMKTMVMVALAGICSYALAGASAGNGAALVLLPALLIAGCHASEKWGQAEQASGSPGEHWASPAGKSSGGSEPTICDIGVRGRRQAYLACGQGQPVLLVHGGSGDMRVWKNQLRAFGRKYRVIAISCRGYYPGEELGPDDTVSLQTYADDLAAFIQTAGLAPAHVVGHSSPGGLASLLLARHHPQLLRSLVLIEPPAFPLLGVNIPPRLPQIIRLLLRQPRLAYAFLKFGARGLRPAIRAFGRGDDAAGLRIFMKANLGDDAFAQISDERFRQAMANIRPLKAQIRAGFPPLSDQDVRRIQAPTLLISGEKSNILLHAVTDKLEELLPRVERVLIARASHNMFETNPQAFNQAVMAFLDKHSSPETPACG